MLVLKQVKSKGGKKNMLNEYAWFCYRIGNESLENMNIEWT